MKNQSVALTSLGNILCSDLRKSWSLGKPPGFWLVGLPCTKVGVVSRIMAFSKYVLVPIPGTYDMLYNMVRRNEAVHGIKVANKLALKQGDYSGLF